MRKPATLVASALVASLACRASGHHASRVEAALERELGAAVGKPVERVACKPASCVATVAGTVVPIAIHDDGHAVTWDIAGLLVTAPELETQVATLLAELDVKARVDCGPRLQVVAAGALITCEITGATRDGVAIAGDSGRALATIDADGNAAIELVLGAEAVAARTADVGQAEDTDLDKLSRALDRDDGVEDDDDGDGGGSGSGSSSASGAAAETGKR